MKQFMDDKNFLKAHTDDTGISEKIDNLTNNQASRIARFLKEFNKRNKDNFNITKIDDSYNDSTIEVDLSYGIVLLDVKK
jgi:hypothetical protein